MDSSAVSLLSFEATRHMFYFYFLISKMRVIAFARQFSRL